MFWVSGEIDVGHHFTVLAIFILEFPCLQKDQRTEVASKFQYIYRSEELKI